MVFHVLVVDDTATDRMITERFLKNSGYQVTCVDSGSSALELLGLREGQEEDDANYTENYKPHKVVVDLIITDYSMPGMTGYELLKKLKGSKSLKEIPVVILSSEPILSRINKCLEEGAGEFFVKPVKLDDVEKLKSHLLKMSNKPKPATNLSTAP